MAATHTERCVGGDVKLKVDREGKDYLEFMERPIQKPAKGTQGESTADKDRCPIKCTNCMPKKRPNKYKTPYEL